MSAPHRRLSTPATYRPLPEQTSGPYHRSVHPERQDVTEGLPGVPLQLALRLLDDGTTPLRDAVVDE